MAMSVLLRSQCRTNVAAALSNVCRFTTTSSKVPLRLLQNKNVTQFITPKINITPITKCIGARQIAMTAVNRSAHGNHSALWTIERGVSVALLAIIPAALAFPSKPLDVLMAITVVMHTHWGLEACFIDYVRPVLFGPTLPKLVPAAVTVFSALFLGALLYLIQTDIGISQTIRKFWAVKAQ